MCIRDRCVDGIILYGNQFECDVAFGWNHVDWYCGEAVSYTHLKLRIQKCRDYLDKKIAESEEPLYGITTGFGSLCSKSISSDELGTLQDVYKRQAL